MDFGVFFCVVGSLDPFANDPNFTPFFSPFQIQMGILLYIMVY
jgi:hypothetical protein